MSFSLDLRTGGITVLLVCVLEITSVLSLQRSATHRVTKNVSEFGSVQKNVTIKVVNNTIINVTADISNNRVANTVNGTIYPKIEPTKRIKKRRKSKRKPNQRKALVPITEPPLLQPVGNQTEPNPNIKKKRRKKLRRKKNRKNRRKQQKLENSNILEVTTAKGIIFPTNTNSNSTINELIRKLNENPEHNFEEFRLMHANRSKSNANRENLANLVAPVPPITKFTRLPNNITLHISIGNETNHKTPIKRSNRCRKKRGGCTQICNPKGKNKCACIKGFALAADRRTCFDVDECKMNNGGCEKECRNTLGSYECTCPNGQRIGDDSRSCDDVNECLLRNGHGPCQDTCENTFGSYRCSCSGLNGTVLGEDGHTCVDVNECVGGNGGCSHICINTMGNAFCSCPDGMELSSDWKTCQDINECENDEIKTSCPNCINTEGSYRCLGFTDYQDDQPSAKITCKPLPLPPVGFVNCPRGGAQKSYAKTGRERITNSPGTICMLVCPNGFKMVGQFYVVCGPQGEWKGKSDAQCIKVDPPTLQCPPTHVFKVDKKSNRALVKFPSPATSISWKYVKSYPSWAKELTGLLEAGHHNINFIARDPNSKLAASCTFKIIVND